ncbi:hypothetical protein BDZ89DRAFT_1071837 [Hymenopellis radicata]|nr:hypothetical protein BDZ89DRAFT_1071837 [Hymenopellis radicata]
MADPTVDKAQVQNLPSAALAYKYVTFVNKMADDSGSGAKTDISSWRPNLENGWYYLGQGAESNMSRAPQGIIVHALEDDALRDVASWEKVWDDAGSGKKRDYSLWRGVPPNDNYVVVGGIFSVNPGYAPPDSVQTRGIKAIRRDLLVFDDTFSVWNDAGTGARKDGSAWKTWSRYGASPYALIPMLGHGAPPRDYSFSLDRSKTLEVKSSASAAQEEPNPAANSNAAEESVDIVNEGSGKE